MSTPSGSRARHDKPPGPLVKIFFDGACRPNPGAMRTAVVARGQAWLRDVPGPGDSNDAEWRALLDALAVARSLGVSQATLLGDSTLVVGLASGTARRIAPRFAASLDEFRVIAGQFERLRVRYVRRGQNLAGIALEKSYGRL